MNVVLTGLRGTGKSSIGRCLADLLAFSFVDTDSVIESGAGAPIAEAVAQHGWPYFRHLERQAIERIAAGDRQVIATGGGTLIDAANARRLKANGLIVLLLCDIAVLQRRIGTDDKRPSLTGQASAVAEMQAVWESRRARYHAVADLAYDVSTESHDRYQDVDTKARALYGLLRPFMNAGEAMNGRS